METRGVLVLCFACLGVFAGARADKKDIYARVVDLMSPGEEFLTEDALVSVFERLENRVQCSGVSCGKVGYICSLLERSRSSARPRRLKARALQLRERIYRLKYYLIEGNTAKYKLKIEFTNVLGRINHV